MKACVSSPRSSVVALLAGTTPAVTRARSAMSSKQASSSQAARFFTFSDPSLRYALIGSILLGISCGLLGSFIVVRKMALVGDTLSHAVLPGVALGFLWNMTKDPLAILIGASIAGLLGTMAVGWITRTTRLKEDAALGMVLATFFAVGICLVTMIQRLPTGNKSGIDKFLFGQAAALSAQDVALMGVIDRCSSSSSSSLFYKEFLVTSFDPGLRADARAAGATASNACSCCCSPSRWWSRCRPSAWCSFRRC